jgi:hypothetical protein
MGDEATIKIEKSNWLLLTNPLVAGVHMLNSPLV